MENAVKLRSRRAIYQSGFIWFLINSLILSIAFYLPHQVLFGDQTSDPKMQITFMILILSGLVHGLSQVILVRRHLQVHFHIFKLTWWVFSMFIGVTLILLTALASIAVLGPSIILGFSKIGTSAPIDTGFSDLAPFSQSLFIIGSCISGGITGLLQFAIIRKHFKSATLWIVATTLSSGLNGLIYLSFLNRAFGDEAQQNYDALLVVTSGKIGVTYGIITGVAMMIMLTKTIKHQTRTLARSSM